MLGVVKDENVTGGCLGSDDAGVLGHASSSIHLALVVDLNFDLDFPADRTKAAKLALLVVIVGRVKLQGIMKLTAATGRMKENCY